MFTAEDSAKLNAMMDADVPFKNPDGTENTDAVNLMNKMGRALAELYATKSTGARRRRRTYRKRRR